MARSVWDMQEQEFKTELEKRVKPELVLINAGDIYGFMAGVFNESATDSLMREWAFQWASEKLNISYDKIYDKWMDS